MAHREMTAEQNAVFQRYAALGDKRSITKLYTTIHTEYPNLSLRQLQDWSRRFSWGTTAKEINAYVVNRVVESLEPVIENMVQEQLRALHTLQKRFLKRLLIDPEDITLTDEQKRRAIDPDLHDFELAVKLERLILGDPTERKEFVLNESRLVSALTKEELIRLAREATSLRFGAVVRELADDIPGEIVALPEAHRD